MEEDMESYVKTVFGHLKNGIKVSNSLPNGENYNYYSCFPTFTDIQKGEIKKLLNSMQSIIERTGIAGNIMQRDVDEKFDLLLEANDVLLDRANLCMDAETGSTRNPTVELIVSQTKVSNNINGTWNSSSSTAQQNEAANNSYSVRLLGGKNIQRPQISFKDKIDNTSKPWQPRIKEKPNALLPLEKSLKVNEEEFIFSHPYEFEIDRFEVPENHLKKVEPIQYKSLENTPLNVIDRVDDLVLMLNDLKQCTEIAVDLEHHSYRSFQGITCLMQISTRNTDYLIDTLTLRSEIHILNEVFTNPKILKVLHGADSDIQWLQRDLSLYVVNMFDTYHAAKQLELPFLSLAYLMKTYCNIDPNKRFQLADWRIRPLPIELIKYAREDTHYLLFIKDILRNALIDTANGQYNVLKVVYNRSSAVCKKIYQKPVWTEESYLDMYRKSQKMFNNRQLYALQELHKWRNQVAREEDDSTSYVLPNHMLLNIAETLPREIQGILACCNPIPPLVRQNLLKIHKMILKAREQLLVKPVFEDDLKQRLMQRSQVSNSEAWLYTPHDIPSGMEHRADLPCLLDQSLLQTPKTINETISHIITVFDDILSKHKKNSTTKKRTSPFISPFERYKRVLPMIAELEAKEREKTRLEEAEKEKQQDIDAQKTAESINRVHEHFLKVTQNLSVNGVDANADHTLSHIPGRKRKRQLSPEPKCEEEVEEKPIISDTRLSGSKRKSDALEDAPEDVTFQKRMRKPKHRKNKFKQRPDIIETNAVPEQVVKFNYKSIDFSNFQGGSRTSGSEVTKFQQQKVKDKGKGGKRNRKKKWNI